MIKFSSHGGYIFMVSRGLASMIFVENPVNWHPYICTKTFQFAAYKT